VERDHERVALVIPGHDHELAPQDGRAALAEAVLDLHVAEIHLPQHLAREAERVDAERAEGHVEVLPVRHGRGRSVRTVGMRALVRHRGRELLAPQLLAARALEGEHDEVLLLDRRAASESAAPLTTAAALAAGTAVARRTAALALLA